MEPKILPDTSKAPTASVESRPVNATLWRRIATVAAFKIATNKYIYRFFNHPWGVLFVGKYCIKASPFTRLAEANAMLFVSEKTSIPVPHVYCAFTRKGRTYIVMERINGEMVGKGWTRRSAESQAKILSQIKGMVEELRRISPPEQKGVSNVDGGPIYDCRLPTSSFWGPFRSIDEFHKKLRNDIEPNVPGIPPDMKELFDFQDQTWPTPVFTHGDLSSLNILARGDEVVAIIDWATAGWLPPYWEYTTAWNVNPQNMFWQEEIDKFLPPDPYLQRMDLIRRTYFGDY